MVIDLIFTLLYLSKKFSGYAPAESLSHVKPLSEYCVNILETE